MNEDLDLLERFSAGREQGAFSALVQRHLNLVYSAALRRTNGDTGLAEDVCQIVFSTLAKEAGRLKPGTVLPGWLYLTTRHAASNVMRGEKRRRQREQEVFAMQTNSEDPEAFTDWEALRPQLDAVMDELNETDRVALLLRYFEGRPFAQLGLQLRISEDAARMRVERALEKLRRLLQKRGIRSSATALGSLLLSQGVQAAPAGLAATVSGAALLGTGATVSLGSIGLLSTMSTTHLITSGIAVLALGTAAYQYNESQQARTELEALKVSHTQVQGELRGLNDKLRQAELNSRQENSSATAKAAEAHADSTAAGPSKAPAGKPGTADFLYSSPEYQELSLRQYAASLGLEFGPLYKKLKLSAAQISSFEALMLKSKQSMTDYLAAARAQGISLEDPSVFKASQAESKQHLEELKVLLGTEGFNSYVDYSRTTAARKTADNLAAKLYYTDTPLSLDQAEQLTGIIAANTGKTTGNGLVRTAGTPNWDAILTQAAGVLAPEQLSTLKALETKRALDQEAALLNMKLQQQALAGQNQPKG